MTDKSVRWLNLQLPPLDGATAAWLLDLCGYLQIALWREYGDQIENHWTASEPGQMIFGRLQPPGPRTKR
jgi:hypothetical protein